MGASGCCVYDGCQRQLRPFFPGYSRVLILLLLLTWFPPISPCPPCLRGEYWVLVVALLRRVSVVGVAFALANY